MAANQPSWPRQWLMTDERIGDRLWEAIDRLPYGRGGIVFRHYSLSEEGRLKLGTAIAAATRRRELVLAVAGSARLAGQLGAALHHNPADLANLPISLSVHDEAEAGKTRELGAELAFVSPLHRTSSHSEASPLGVKRAAALARLVDCPTIALGGMNSARFDALERAHPGLFYGFAGIDCWLTG